ncbi:transmembrane protein 70 homolog, mitochondrial-like [Mizuhopecten yessoensis]|uniref:Transmembrane protein 70-like n=1 Tax=Mizuhopecten yessoensis TaxID=6573 RepID=A0A210QMC0_MIZYE|nr:transmembrane protein 70 homolog, mitochondrial-like [Mizuhopecten yessoensis]OWF49886.1 Transmembrane protein 70-like [Mizuhopecten yessoensis]
MATSGVFCSISRPIWHRFRQAACSRLTIKHQTQRLLHTRHMVPYSALTTQRIPTNSRAFTIQSRSMSTDNTPIPGSQPNSPVQGLPLVDAVKGNLVYYGPITKNIKIVKYFSITTSGIFLSMFPFVLPDVAKLPAVLQFMLGGVVGAFTFLTPVMIHVLTKRYVTDLYYNEDSNTFTATTLSVFCRRKATVFTPEDVTLPSVASLFCVIKVKGKPMFVDPSLFRSRTAYIKLMGFDKPMDFSDIEGFDKEKED